MADQTAPHRERPLVLLVDDSVDNREMYVEALGRRGYQVEEATTGGEAIDKAQSLVPDVVVMDLSLPGMDGWQATRHLRNDVRTSHIPIVVLSGHSMTDDTAGWDMYLTKPCLPDELAREIQRLLTS